MGERRRGFEFVMGGIMVGAVVWSASTACNLSNAMGPIPPACETTPQAICYTATMNVVADGAYTLSFGGATYTGNGAGTFTDSNILADSTYAVSGQLSTAHMAITITSRASSGTGGVVSGSVQATQGPVASTGSCSVSYAVPAGAPVPQGFAFQFRVGSNSPAC
jgi:hypothetical protein